MNYVGFPIKVISSWYITRTSSWERRGWSLGLADELLRQATSFSARFLFPVCCWTTQASMSNECLLLSPTNINHPLKSILLIRIQQKSTFALARLQDSMNVQDNVLRTKRLVSIGGIKWLAYHTEQGSISVVISSSSSKPKCSLSSSRTTRIPSCGLSLRSSQDKVTATSRLLQQLRLSLSTSKFVNW